MQHSTHPPTHPPTQPKKRKIDELLAELGEEEAGASKRSAGGGGSAGGDEVDSITRVGGWALCFCW